MRYARRGALCEQPEVKGSRAHFMRRTHNTSTFLELLWQIRERTTKKTRGSRALSAAAASRSTRQFRYVVVCTWTARVGTVLSHVSLGFNFADDFRSVTAIKETGGCVKMSFASSRSAAPTTARSTAQHKNSSSFW